MTQEALEGSNRTPLASVRKRGRQGDLLEGHAVVQEDDSVDLGADAVVRCWTGLKVEQQNVLMQSECYVRDKGRETEAHIFLSKVTRRIQWTLTGIGERREGVTGR